MIYISGERRDTPAQKPVAYGKDRCTILGAYIIEHGATVRQAAQKFGISKSTVHKDVTETLSRVDPVMYAEVREVLDVNKQERHLRGGEATRKKYSRERESE